MVRKDILAAAAALAAFTLPQVASAYTAVAVTQPAGFSCAAVKIAGQYNANSWGNMNCSNGLAYGIKNRTHTYLLHLPGGALSEYVYDIDDVGLSVGAAVFPGGVVIPVKWNSVGTPAPLPSLSGYYAEGRGVYHGGGFVVGDGLPAGSTGPVEGIWFQTGPTHLVGPPPTTGSVLNDVSRTRLYVGQLNGAAAYGKNPASLLLIPGLSPSSVAYQLMDKNVIVGHQDFGGTCGSRPTGAGFRTQFPSFAITTIAPLGSDCTSSAEDINDNYGVVGSSFNGIVQRAEGYQVTGFGGGYVDFNALAGAPWVQLSDAPGISDADEIIATDTGVPLSQVYIID